MIHWSRPLAGPISAHLGAYFCGRASEAVVARNLRPWGQRAGAFPCPGIGVRPERFTTDLEILLPPPFFSPILRAGAASRHEPFLAGNVYARVRVAFCVNAKSSRPRHRLRISCASRRRSACEYSRVVRLLYDNGGRSRQRKFLIKFIAIIRNLSLACPTTQSHTHPFHSGSLQSTLVIWMGIGIFFLPSKISRIIRAGL